jgi:hypothetical protein
MDIVIRCSLYLDSLRRTGTVHVYSNSHGSMHLRVHPGRECTCLLDGCPRTTLRDNPGPRQQPWSTSATCSSITRSPSQAQTSRVPSGMFPVRSHITSKKTSGECSMQSVPKLSQADISLIPECHSLGCIMFVAGTQVGALRRREYR